MDEAGRDSLLTRLVEATEKSAVANARLIELATEERAIEYTPGPPYCPNCSVFNPRVETTSEARGGPLAEFVLAAKCMNCGQLLFAKPQGWDMFNTLEEAVRAQEGREDERN